tara:strand:- start:35057 stop:36139 length:1083 start_codon:yes stop_codon:yes gene_type:complete
MAEQKQAIRVIQWATGSVGKFSIGAFHNKPGFQLVGCWVHSADKAGKDAGEIAGIGTIGVSCSNSVEEILALDADVVHYAPLLANVDEMCRILESGKNLVTPSGFTTVRNKKDAAKLAAACHKGGVSMHGSGIHPGFSGDRLPIVLSAMSRSIRKITVHEIVDMSRVNESWDMVTNLGFDMSPEDAKANPPFLLEVMSTIFFESIALVAEALGIEIEEYEKKHRFALAPRDIEVDLELGTRKGLIRKGHVAGQNFNYAGLVKGQPVIEFKTFWPMDESIAREWGHLEPWAYKINIEGDPDLRLHFTCGKEDGSDSAALGILCTAMNCVNSMPQVVAAPPGIVTQLDMKVIPAYQAFELPK